jgi:HEAT repeat protein
MTSEKEDDDVDGQSDSSVGADKKDSGSLSAREKAKRETERNRPDVGYYLIKRDTFKEPWRQETALTSKHSLRLSEMSVPDDSSIIKHHIRDEESNVYDDELRGDTEEPANKLLDDLKESWKKENEKNIRVKLAKLAKAAEEDPSSCVDAVEVVIAAVKKGSQPVQSEALGILQAIAAVKPEMLSGAVAPTIDLLQQDVHPKLTAQAFKLLSVLIPFYPEETSQAVSTLASLLHNDDLSDEPIVKALAAIVEEKPGALTGVVPELGTYLESNNRPNAAQKYALVALGQTAKEHPGPVSDITPQLIDLLDSQHKKIRVNAAGVLADVAETHPTAVEPAIPDIMNLLAGADTKGRHNAMSIVTRVARANPSAVQPASDELIELLGADDAETRMNACSALQSMNATSALPTLRELKTNDPDKEIREAAKQAIENISGE